MTLHCPYLHIQAGPYAQSNNFTLSLSPYTSRTRETRALNPMTLHCPYLHMHAGPYAQSNDFTLSLSPYTRRTIRSIQ